MIENGSAEVVRDGERIAELGPGDFLGEMGIVSQAVRNATVRTTSSGTVGVEPERPDRRVHAVHGYDATDA